MPPCPTQQRRWISKVFPPGESVLKASCFFRVNRWPWSAVTTNRVIAAIGQFSNSPNHISHHGIHDLPGDEPSRDLPQRIDLLRSHYQQRNPGYRLCKLFAGHLQEFFERHFIHTGNPGFKEFQSGANIRQWNVIDSGRQLPARFHHTESLRCPGQQGCHAYRGDGWPGSRRGLYRYIIGHGKHFHKFTGHGKPHGVHQKIGHRCFFPGNHLWVHICLLKQIRYNPTRIFQGFHESHGHILKQILIGLPNLFKRRFGFRVHGHFSCPCLHLLLGQIHSVPSVMITIGIYPSRRRLTGF